jgi:hypothetical protein
LSTVCNWNKTYFYEENRLSTLKETMEESTPKTQLALGSMTEEGRQLFKDELAVQGWTELGWYPSLHGPYSTIYPIYVYAKVQPKMPLVERYSGYLPSLGCSVAVVQGSAPKVGRCADFGFSYFAWEGDQKRFTIWRWLHSYGHPVEAFERLGFTKFATTTLASYWFFGLKPGEAR